MRQSEIRFCTSVDEESKYTTKLGSVLDQGTPVDHVQLSCGMNLTHADILMSIAYYMYEAYEAWVLMMAVLVTTWPLY